MSGQEVLGRMDGDERIGGEADRRGIGDIKYE